MRRNDDGKYILQSKSQERENAEEEEDEAAVKKGWEINGFLVLYLL